MRLISSLLTLAALGYGVFWLGKHHPEVTQSVFSMVQGNENLALQPIYTPDQVIEKNSRLLTKGRSVLQGDPHITYVPLLRMDVKYADTSYTTGEGTLLWDLADGEMILDTSSWQKTHGLADCIRADASKQECKVLALVAKKGGMLGREGIKKGLRVDADLVDQWLDSCRQKKLLVPSGNGYRLHMHDPRFPTTPISLLDVPLTTYTAKKAKTAAQRFAPDDVTEFVVALFGSDFAIQSAEVVLLPVYSVTRETADGRLSTHFFNSLSGREIKAGSIIY